MSFDGISERCFFCFSASFRSVLDPYQRCDFAAAKLRERIMRARSLKSQKQINLTNIIGLLLSRKADTAEVTES